jgi:pimeloyl-ACP methyl ester carboxylesterase
MTDLLEKMPERHRAIGVIERLRVALLAIGPENGRLAEQRANALSAAQADLVPSAESWFAAGERVGYDPNARTVLATREAPRRIFLRREGDLAQAVSFLPGFPDGSFGWAKVRPHLPNAAEMPKLFVDYVGMGDSDKPKDYPYSTAERTDLIEAIWRDLGVQSTTLVGFDFSSLVILEHLRRRLERAARGKPVGGPDIRGVFIFNGGLFTDGHSHPWYTTPMLRRLPERARRRLGQPFALFKRMPGVRKMWSKGYRVSDAELRELHSAMDRHDGLFYLSAAAGFMVDHKAQGDRLDFGQLFEAYRGQFPFVVGGSDQDPFEHRQVDLAQERLGKLGLQIERLPGGHLTTNEQPDALASLIAKFERGLTKMPPASESV